MGDTEGDSGLHPISGSQFQLYFCPYTLDGLGNMETIATRCHGPNFKFSILSGYGIPGVINDIHPGLHAGMEIAGNLDGRGIALEIEMLGHFPLGLHDDVEQVLGDFRVAPHVVILEIAVAENEILAHLNDLYLRHESKPDLVHVDRLQALARFWVARYGLMGFIQFFQINKGVNESAGGRIVHGFGWRKPLEDGLGDTPRVFDYSGDRGHISIMGGVFSLSRNRYRGQSDYGGGYDDGEKEVWESGHGI